MASWLRPLLGRGPLVWRCQEEAGAVSLPGLLGVLRGRFHHRSFQPSPRMEATLRDGRGPEAQKPSLKRWRPGKGPRATALPQHQERMYLLVTKNSPAHRGRPRPQAGPCRGAAGVGPASGSAWECGPAQGRKSSSPQASATPWAGLSDPRTEDAGKLRGAGRERDVRDLRVLPGPSGPQTEFLLPTLTVSPPRPAGRPGLC